MASAVHRVEMYNFSLLKQTLKNIPGEAGVQGPRISVGRFVQTAYIVRTYVRYVCETIVSNASMSTPQPGYTNLNAG